MTSLITSLRDLLPAEESLPSSEWNLKGIRSGQCLSYIAWNTNTREAIVIDPKDEDLESYRKIAGELSGYLWMGVIDTHTHADHISVAHVLSNELRAPLLMHQRSPSSRVSFRVSKETALPSRAGPILFYFTPGHTQDSVVVVWGPFAFTGDTVVIGDTGRDDLPGGSAEDHFESLVKLKEVLRPEMIVLAGHDGKGSRASTWKRELLGNVSLKETRDEFVRASTAFSAPAPALLRESLRENFK